MRASKYQQEINELLSRGGTLSVNDFMAVCHGMPKPSVYSKIHSLVRDNKIYEVGRGQYQAGYKLKYGATITDWMLEVNRLLIQNCVGVNHCIRENNSNLYVEAAKADLQQVYDCLIEHYKKVVYKKEADRFPAPLDGYIILGPMISTAPLIKIDGVDVPSLEKNLVDSFCSNKSTAANFSREIQRAMEVFPLNINRLNHYAARRGVSNEIAKFVSSVNNERIEMFSATQKYLATIPILRAWVFGSFARGEETPSSDLDLLVDYDFTSKKISLLDTIRYKLDLEKIIGREVDLISNGSLKPFAVESVERDKYLIYER